MGGAARIARRFETERRGGGRREANAGVALRRQLGVERTGLVALREIVPVVVEAHGLGLGEASQHGVAELARVALVVGIERPAPFPGVDPHRERARWRDRGFDGSELRMGLARENFDAGGLEPRQRIGDGLLGVGRGDRPAGSLDKGEAARFSWRRRARWSEQSGIAGIAAGANRDLVSDLPGVVQHRSEDAGRALAQAVVASAAIERADRDLEADAAAVARGANGRADHLRAERRADYARDNAGGGAAARSARGAAQVMRVARAARLGRGNFSGDGLSDDDRAGLAQRGNTRAIAFGAEAGEQRRAVFGWHVRGLDDVLDADRHAIDLRARPARAPARARLVGSCARTLEVEIDEGADLGLERGDIGKTAFEEVARRVGAAGKARRRREIRLGRKL